MKDILVTYREGGNLRIRHDDQKTQVIADIDDTSWTPEWRGKGLITLHNTGNGYVVMTRGQPFVELAYDTGAELYEALRAIHENYDAYRDSTTRYELKEIK